MKYIQYALYAGFGAFLAHIGFPLSAWQFWVAMLFLAAVDVTSFLRATQ